MSWSRPILVLFDVPISRNWYKTLSNLYPNLICDMNQSFKQIVFRKYGKNVQASAYTSFHFTLTVPLSLLMNYMFDGEHVSNEFKPLGRVFHCFQLKLKTFRIITISNPPGGGILASSLLGWGILAPTLLGGILASSLLGGILAPTLLGGE